MLSHSRIDPEESEYKRLVLAGDCRVRGAIMKARGWKESSSVRERFMGSSFRLVTAMGLLASILVPIGEQASAQVAGPAATTTHADPLLTLNNASRLFYTQAKATALEQHGPVIIVSGDDLILRKGKSRVQVRVIPEIYHTLKAIAHVPMAIDVALAAHSEEKAFSDDFLQELRDYRKLLPTAEARLTKAGLNPEQIERQKAILTSCMAFVDSVVAKKRCPDAERSAFARRLNPLVMANAAAAARAVLDALHRQVSQWTSGMNLDEWDHLTILIIGRQLPRKDNLAVQYFARLLGERGEGQRIIYAEGLAEEPRALDLLATHLVDTGIAEDFFNDFERMNRDLLSDGARDYLPLLIGENQKPPVFIPGISR